MRVTRPPGCRNRASRLRFAVLAVAGAIAASSCATPRGWVKVTRPERLPWTDDGDTASLHAALDQSKAYLQRIAPATRFGYGDQVYSAEELIRSLALFSRLAQDLPDPAAFRAALLRQFDVYESVAESGENLFTGYYEPVIAGSDTPTGALTTPLYARPADLVEIPLDRFDKTLPARKLMGRVDNGTVVPYYSRGDIALRDAVKGVARPIVYVNQVDLFFLQIQGSGS